MVRRYCDYCNREIIGPSVPKGGTINTHAGRLGTEITCGRTRLRIEIITGDDEAWNKGDFCKYCIIEAVKKLDDRPTLKEAGEQQ